MTAVCLLGPLSDLSNKSLFHFHFQVESILNDIGNLESVGPDYHDDDLNLIEPSLIQLSSTVSGKSVFE